ncbi:MAG: hypothetical protein IIB61_08290 [Planctomycetes bacterium]|nr:hypothetical protein [Planctomycetota bacterium]
MAWRRAIKKQKCDASMHVSDQSIDHRAGFGTEPRTGAPSFLAETDTPTSDHRRATKTAAVCRMNEVGRIEDDASIQV